MIMTFVIVVVVAAAAFFVGMKYQQSKTPSAGAQGANSAVSGTGTRTGRGGQNGTGGGTRGQVVSVDSNSITVKLSDGSSKIVLINGSTQIGKAQKAVQSDIQSGDTVMAFGTANSDGSITAQNIQINPLQGNFGRPGSSPSPGQ